LRRKKLAGTLLKRAPNQLPLLFLAENESDSYLPNVNRTRLWTTVEPVDAFQNAK